MMASTYDPLTAVLERLDDVQKRSGYWMARCPTRRDSNPSLTIALGSKGQVMLHDFGGATVEEIVAALGLTMSDLFVDDPTERKQYVEATRTPKQRKPKTYRKPDVPVEATFREGAAAWFAKRAITPATLQHFGVYTATRYFHKPQKETPAICVPYRKNGEAVNVKYRCAIDKDFLMEVDAEPVFYNLDILDLVQQRKEVVIVEGEIDLFSLYEARILNVISPPNGSESITEEVFASASAMLGDESVRVILAGDNDEAGVKMMDEIARRVGKERCARVLWPEGCKDANDCLVKHGPERVMACVTNAEQIAVSGIIGVDDVMDEVWSLYSDGLPPGTSTGLHSLDEHYTVKTGYWTMVIASPGAGKSNILDQIVTNLAENEDWRFAIASLENPSVARHIANILPKFLRKPFGAGRSERMTAEEVERGRIWMADHFAFIQPEEPSIEEILMRARSLVFSKGINGLILDPWNEMEHPPSGLNSGDYISKCLTLIRRFAYLHDIHIWLVVHPTKLNKDSDGQYPVPTLYDASGSAMFVNKADYGLAMWRDRKDAYAPVQVHVQKTRHAEVGTLGTVKIGYDTVTTRYYDLAASGESDASYDWKPKNFAERMREQEEAFADNEEAFAEIAAGSEA